MLQPPAFIHILYPMLNRVLREPSVFHRILTRTTYIMIHASLINDKALVSFKITSPIDAGSGVDVYIIDS